MNEEEIGKWWYKLDAIVTPKCQTRMKMNRNFKLICNYIHSTNFDHIGVFLNK